MRAKSRWRLSTRQAILIQTILLLLFLFRVLAQLAQYFIEYSFLPRFESWHSETLPYAWLVISQVLIIAGVSTLIVRIHLGQYRYYRRRAWALLCLGSLYFLFMLVRLLLGLTILAGHSWFGATLPAFFHLILAGIVITAGLHEYSHS